MPDSMEDLEALERRIHELETELVQLRAPTPAPTPPQVQPGSQLGAACSVDAKMTRLLLDKAMAMARVGVWSVDVATGQVTWSDEVFRIHELPVGDAPSVTDAIACYAPEARDVVKGALHRLRTMGEAYDIELPLVTAKNNRVWVRSTGDVERNTEGNPIRLYGVFQEVTTQETLARERERLRDQAESATRATSEFLARMSHEIRTPLNGILGMAQVLERGSLDEEELSQVAAIRASGSALLVLLNDVLDLAKIKSGKLSIKSVPFDLEAIVRESVDRFESQPRESSVELHVCVAPGATGSWVGDPVRIQQIVVNLLGNALKFTEEGSVEVRVQEAHDRGVRIEVIDTGVGIEPDVEDHLFEGFQCAGSAATQRFDGSGLGLAVCRRLVDQMGGQIGVETTLGTGSVFWFELPVDRAAVPTSGGTEAVIERSGPVTQRATAALPTRVLVVEDNPVNQVVARKLVESLGNEVTLACNGDEGVDAAFAAEFDIVLMDCQMPVLDGYQATRRLRRMEIEAGRPHIPVIAMTANAMDGDRERCLDAGMDDYLPKPVDRDQLAAVIGRWVDRSPRSVA